MKNGIAAALIVGALLSTSGSTLAGGKVGGGMDAVDRSRPVYGGKLGGAGGMDVVGRDNLLFAGSSVDAIDEELARVDGLSATLTELGGGE